jgi:hypothetical protein
MARRVDSFEDEQTRRYPWDQWTDGSIWEIRRSEDYDVATENMRVNLHERAKSQALVVKTKKVGDDDWEGLRFRFEQKPVATVHFPQGRIPTGPQRHPRHPTTGF